MDQPPLRRSVRLVLGITTPPQRYSSLRELSSSWAIGGHHCCPTTPQTAAEHRTVQFLVLDQPIAVPVLLSPIADRLQLIQRPTKRPGLDQILLSPGLDQSALTPGLDQTLLSQGLDQSLLTDSVMQDPLLNLPSPLCPLQQIPSPNYDLLLNKEAVALLRDMSQRLEELLCHAQRAPAPQQPNAPSLRRQRNVQPPPPHGPLQCATTALLAPVVPTLAARTLQAALDASVTVVTSSKETPAQTWTSVRTRCCVLVRSV